MSAPSSRPFYYHIFGGTLESPVEFPELAVAEHPEAADWVFRMNDGAPPTTGPETGRNGHGLVFHEGEANTGGVFGYGDTGWYAVSRDGREITWYPGEDRRMDIVRSVVLGPAFALCLEQAGVLCLHGSAVVMGTRGVAFLAPKHFGKSTLAAALLAAGARLVTDDSVAIELGPPATMRPGVTSLRLWPDTARAIDAESLPGTTREGPKHLVTDMPDPAVTRDSVALECCYLLRPTLEARPQAASRRRLSLGEATLGLTLNAKLTDELVGLGVAARRLQTAARVARTVPVCELEMVRDFERLPEVVAEIMSWSET